MNRSARHLDVELADMDNSCQIAYDLLRREFEFTGFHVQQLSLISLPQQPSELLLCCVAFLREVIEQFPILIESFKSSKNALRNHSTPGLGRRLT